MALGFKHCGLLTPKTLLHEGNADYCVIKTLSLKLPDMGSGTLPRLYTVVFLYLTSIPKNKLVHETNNFFIQPSNYILQKELYITCRLYLYTL
jgi:hypothetical protein